MEILLHEARPVQPDSPEHDECDADWWEIRTRDVTPAGWHDEPLVSFPDWLETQASYFKSLETAAGSWLAGKIATLAEVARHLDADGPDSYEDRHDAMIDAGIERARARLDSLEASERVLARLEDAALTPWS